jgi:hypothetical protein
MLQPLVRRSWAEQGQTPVIEHWHRHDRLSGITALVLSPGRRRVNMYFQLLDHNAKAEDFAWFLEYLHQEVKRKMWIVWDNLSAHRKAESVLEQHNCRWADFEHLPPYSPELNPVEHVWTTAKWGRMANVPPDDTQQLYDHVHETLTGQANETQLLKAHFRWAGLDLN